MALNRNSPLLITDLPNEILGIIMSHFSYDEIAKNRIVSKKFNDIGKSTLNRGCKLLVSDIEEYMIEIKDILSSQESDEKSHPLYEHFRVLESLRDSIKSLIVLYSYFNNDEIYCFIAGEVIDEARRLINVLRNTETLTVPGFKFTRDFHGLARMAEKHFEDLILPLLEQFENTIASNSDTVENVAEETTNNTNASESSSNVDTNEPLTKEKS